jgi:hypothetical protein
MEDEDFFIELPVIVPPEFRLYYDDKGNIICYTCEKLEGNFIVIDNITFAEARHDVKVVDGKLKRKTEGSYLYTLIESLNGVRTTSEDITIIVDNDYIGETKTWELKQYEL